MKAKKLVLVGDSAFAEIAYEYFEKDSEYTVAAFSVEREYLKRDALFGLPVVPFEDVETRFSQADHDVYVATSYTQLNRLRTRLSGAAKEKGYRLASYVSSRAFVWPNVRLGEHCFIFEDNTVQPFVTIGDNVVLWSGNHIGHHSTIGSNCFISSHVVVAGFSHVGENSFLGVNSSIANNVRVGRDNWLNPNVAITRDTKDGSMFKAPKPEISKLSALEYFGLKP